MELKFVHIFGPAILMIAFLLLGRGIVKKARGQRFNALPALMLMLVAIAARFMWSGQSLAEAYDFINGHASLLDRLTLLLADFGIAMTIDAAYLALNKQQAKLFWVPGILVLMLSGLMYIGLIAFNSIAQTFKQDPATAELLVELGPDDKISEIKPILRKYHADAERTFKNVDMSEDEDLAQFYTVFVDSAVKDLLLKELQKDRENIDDAALNNPIKLIEPKSSIQLTKSKIPFLANDPYLANEWYAESLDYNGVYGFLKNHEPRKKIQLAIVDTGVEGDHEDLSAIFQASSGGQDGHGHGTHCAGLAGAATNNQKGVGSLNWEGKYITITGYHALDAKGRGSDKTVSQAIIDAAEGGADVISMSLGGYAPFGPPKAQKEAIEYALNKHKAIVVVAAGNSSADAKYFSPANIEGVIVVAAVDQQLNKASFSNTNTSLKMPIAAPGVDMISAFPGSEYRNFSGTSMATPVVAGLIGIMKSFNPDLTAKQVHNILVSTGTDIKDAGKTGKLIAPKAAITKAAK